jgi:DNA mismatch endonuclease (patch repair protein)
MEISKEVRSKIMSKIKSKNTSPEKTLRKALWDIGLRFRIQYGKEKIDIAFPAKKIAIFVDGCFWHSCPIHGHIPKSNKDYWVAKLAKNIERAKDKDIRLESDGWKILHFWEHEIKNNLDDCIQRILNLYHSTK